MHDEKKSISLTCTCLLVIYRSNDFAWNDHPTSTNPSHQTLRAPSPAKNKLSTSARPLGNGTLHESTAATTGNSTMQLASSTAQSLRDDMNNGDFLVTATSKSRQAARLQRTNSQFEKSAGPTGHGLPLRTESYRSSRLDYSVRPRNTSSKQRNYLSSKTSFYDINGGEFYLNGGQDENLYYHQQQINALTSSQRLNSSTFDLNTSRKPFTSHKSNSFNVAANTHAYHQSSQELHRSDTNIDRNNQNRFTGRGTNSKEQIISIPKQRYASNGPGERHSSPHSYPSRDPNDSYAYNNVKKYIEENDLMSSEKEQIIRNWVLDVEKYRHQLQKLDWPLPSFSSRPPDSRCFFSSSPISLSCDVFAFSLTNIHKYLCMKTSEKNSH